MLSVMDNRARKNLLRVKVPQWRVWYKWYTYRVLPDKISRYCTVITHRFNGRERVGVIVKNLRWMFLFPSRPVKCGCVRKEATLENSSISTCFILNLHLLTVISLVAEWKFLKKLFRKYSLWAIHFGVIIVAFFLFLFFLFVCLKFCNLLTGSSCFERPQVIEGSAFT